MAASKHSEDSQRIGHSAVVKPDNGPVETLLKHGVRMRLASPELALVFGERAAALAEAGGSEQLWVRAEALAVFARIRLGERAGVVDRAVVALRAAEAAGDAELGAVLRTDLALCARSVGAPLTGLAALRPVLASSGLRPVVRAVALVQLVGCLTTLGRRTALDRALAEADELISADSTADAGSRTLLRVMVCTRSAAHLRRNGDIAAATESAQRGLDLLAGLADRAADGGEFGTRLVLELVCALLDRGAIDDAAALAKPLMGRPTRAAAIAPMAWLRLAVATRILLPAGSAEAAGALVRDALYSAGSHGLQALTARLWLELAHIEERLGRAAEAVRCLREARTEEHRSGRVRRQATSLLTGEFGRGEQPTVDIDRLLQASKVSAQAAVSAPTAEPAATPRVERVFADTPVPEPAAEPLAAAQAEAAPRHADNAPSARSVLERLGVTVGSGGRRRARHAEPEAETAPQAEATDPQAEHAARPEPADAARDHPMLPRLKLPGTLAPDALRLVTGVADADSGTGKVNDTDAVADPRLEEPAGRALQPQELDSLLAVFSNWTDDDHEPADISARARRPRPERTRPGMAAVDPGAAHGRVVNGESPARGRHHGEG
ncbi:MAG: hypothetical protein ACRDQ7_26445 [Haloechinothrix sp.]